MAKLYRDDPKALKGPPDQACNFGKDRLLTAKADVNLQRKVGNE